VIGPEQSHQPDSHEPVARAQADGLFDLLDGGLGIAEEIIGASVDYDQSRIVVTSRPFGYRAQRLEAAGFCHATIEDLTSDQIEAFVQGWFAIVFSGAPEEAAKRVSRIENALQASPALRALAGNPLLLTIIVIIARHRELPHDRARLYDHALRVLAFHWDVTGRFDKDELPGDFMDDDDKIALLQRIAWRMQESEGGLASNVVSGEILLEEIEGYLSSERWEMAPKECHPLARAMLDQLRERNFVLCLHGPDLYGFVHRTFLDYLVATEIVRCFEKERSLGADELKALFRDRAGDEVWREILRLICGQLDAPIAAELIGEIVPAAETATIASNTQSLVFTLECLSDVKELNRVRPVCTRSIEALLAWYDEAAHGTYILTDREDAYSNRLLNTLGTIADRMPRGLQPTEWIAKPGKIVIGASKPSWQVFVAIVGAVWSPTEEMRQSLLALSERDHVFHRDLSYYALAKHFATHDETRPFLLTRAVEDLDQSARHSALEALGQHFAAHDETRPFLMTRAVEDPDEYARSSALQALGQHFATHDETRPFLMTRAIEDPEPETRQAALGALVSVDRGTLGSERVILSRDFDGVGPWFDPLEPITSDRVEEIATKFGQSPSDVRARFERVADELPLRLEWKEA